MRDNLEYIACDANDKYVLCVAQPGGIVGHSVQHALEIGGRTADLPEDIASRSLLPSKFLQLIL